MATTHTRTLIRDYITGQLKAAATMAGNNVFPSWEAPLSAKALPVILVFDDDEDVNGEFYQDMPRRVLLVGVEARVKAASAKAVDDLLDIAALQIEPVVMADERQGGLAQETHYKGARKDRKAEGNTFSGSVVLTYEVHYKMELPPEPPVLDDFETFNADYDLAPADGRIDANDRVTLPTE